MDQIQELRDKLAHETKSAGDILDLATKENRSATTEEMVKWNEHTERAVGLDKAIEDAEATVLLKEQQKVNEARLLDRGTRTVPSIPITSVHPADRVDDPDDPEPVRYGRTVAFAETSEGRAKAYRSGLWVRAMFCQDEGARRKCINMGIGDTRALSEGINIKGGALVPGEMLQAIIDLRVRYGRFRENAQVIPMGRDTMMIPRSSSDMTASYAGENQTISESDQAFTDVELTAKKLGILTRVSSELAEDAIIDIADMVARKMAYAFALKEDTDGFTGDGSSSAGGVEGIQWIFENDNTLAGAIDTSAGGTPTFVLQTAATISTIMAQLPDYAAENAKFYCSRVGAELMFGRLKAAGGGNTITDLEGKVQPAYLGYPIVTVNVMRKVTTTLNDLVLFLFGDLSLSSTIGDSRGISVKTSEERYFDSDQIAIKATERIAIVNHDFGTTTAGDTGPIVAGIGIT